MDKKCYKIKSGVLTFKKDVKEIYPEMLPLDKKILKQLFFRKIF